MQGFTHVDRFYFCESQKAQKDNRVEDGKEDTGSDHLLLNQTSISSRRLLTSKRQTEVGQSSGVCVCVCVVAESEQFLVNVDSNVVTFLSSDMIACS